LPRESVARAPNIEPFRPLSDASIVAVYRISLLNKVKMWTSVVPFRTLSFLLTAVFPESRHESINTVAFCPNSQALLPTAAMQAIEKSASSE